MESQGSVTVDLRSALKTPLQSHRGRIAVTIFSAALLMSTVVGGGADAQTLTILHNFSAGDGVNPRAGLIRDSAGNLYGVTGFGGSANAGIVFKLDGSGNKFTVLHNFSDGTAANDGANPIGRLTVDSAGNLYGTTLHGGSSGDSGTVFKLDTSGNNYAVLHRFSEDDGANPIGGLILDSAGNLYGTTSHGGSLAGWGTVFKLDTSGNIDSRFRREPVRHHDPRRLFERRDRVQARHLRSKLHRAAQFQWP
jgi:uncharacterized repeat protein (TIGR03803 family)